MVYLEKEEKIMELKYGNRVKVTKGFYEGMIGRVKDYYMESYYFETNVVTSYGSSEMINVWIKQDELEKIGE